MTFEPWDNPWNLVPITVSDWPCSPSVILRNIQGNRLSIVCRYRLVAAREVREHWPMLQPANEDAASTQQGRLDDCDSLRRDAIEKERAM